MSLFELGFVIAVIGLVVDTVIVRRRRRNESLKEKA
jgi:hypothetical protein